MAKCCAGTLSMHNQLVKCDLIRLNSAIYEMGMTVCFHLSKMAYIPRNSGQKLLHWCHCYGTTGARHFGQYFILFTFNTA